MKKRSFFERLTGGVKMEEDYEDRSDIVTKMKEGGNWME